MTGQALGNLAGRDQWTLDQKILQLQSLVGLDELIAAKAAGATFGALTKSEMDLLISTAGSLNGLMAPADLKRTMNTVMDLNAKALVRQKSDFSEMYPDQARPWETQQSAPVGGAPQMNAPGTAHPDDIMQMIRESQGLKNG
jgi:hypothetical protein